MRKEGSWRHALPRLIGLALMLVMAAAILAACGSSSSSSSGSGGGGGTAADAKVLSEAEAVLKKGYAGEFQPPPKSGPAAAKGKTVWFISCGQAFEACSYQSELFQEAGKALGWNVVVQDGKAEPTLAANIIRQAIAAHVDGVIAAFYDCPSIKSALVDAKDANMPVVGLDSVDCNSPVFGGDEPPLFAAGTKLRGSTDPTSWYKEWATARADYTIAKTKGEGKVIQIWENTQAIQQVNGNAYAAQLEKCGGCELKRVAFNFSQVPNPATQTWKSAMLSNPTFNTVDTGMDALMFLGLQTAVEGAGRPIEVEGAEMNPGNVALIHEGQQASAAGLPYGWFAWAAADTLNRLFAGENPAKFPNEGSGWQFIDAEHNLPPEGQPWEPPVNYRAAYEKIWDGTGG